MMREKAVITYSGKPLMISGDPLNHMPFAPQSATKTPEFMTCTDYSVQKRESNAELILGHVSPQAIEWKSINKLSIVIQPDPTTFK